MNTIGMALALTLVSGCALDAESEGPVTAPTSGKADGYEQVPELIVVRNDLDVPITVVLSDTYDAWDRGSSADGIDVDAYGTSDYVPIQGEVPAIVVVDAYDLPLDPDSLRGSYFTSEAGAIVLELVVGIPYADVLGPAILDASELGGDGGEIDYGNVNAEYDVFAEVWTGSAVGYSKTEATVYTWTTDSDKRATMKSEARNEALRITADFRRFHCMGRGGTIVATQEDCSYSPTAAISAPFFATSCRASCDFTYVCQRPQ